MKFQIHPSLLVAQAVVAHLQTMLEAPPSSSDIPDEKWDEVSLTLGSFQNCREQGLTLSAWGVPYDDKLCLSTCYYIAEHRSSDFIVVYVYKDTSNASDDGIYDQRYTFGYGQYHEAAKFIITDITKRLEKKLADESKEIESKDDNIQKLHEALDDQIRDLRV
jgi:hypothetical protein